MDPVAGRLLERRALLDGAREAAVCGERRLTYHELDLLCGRMAALLGDHDIARGDRVAALLHNGIEYCALYHAAARLGAVLCPVNWRLTAPEIAYILENCGARVLFYDTAFGEVTDSLPALPDLRHIIAVDHGSEAGFAKRLAECKPIMEPCPAKPEDPLLIVHTSGTTGRPKGAVLTQAQMVWSSMTMVATIDWRRGDVGLVSAPMFHVGGLSFTTLYAHIGATAVFSPVWEPDGALALISRESVNHFFAVATMLDGLTRSAGFASTNLGSVRWIMSGGGPLPTALIDLFADRGIPLIQSYGTTETAGPATLVPLAEAVARAGTSGLPFFHTDVRIVDASGRPAKAGSKGEVHVKGPHVASGYWRDREATEQGFDAGWFRTGDEGHMDVDGYLTIDGRIKETIITGGENVHPAEVESILQTHPHVVDVAVIGVPDDHWGEIICAVVHSGAAEPPTLADLVSHCADRIAKYKYPRRLVTHPAPLPRNPMGKLLRSEIQRLISG